MTARNLQCIVDDLAYAEGLRWYAGRLWFSDMVANRVYSWKPGESARVITEAINGPSGIGFDDAGNTLVVSRDDVLHRIDASGEVAPLYDLSLAGSSRANDMVTDTSGMAYVGSIGRVYANASEEGRDEKPGSLFLVEDVNAANGAVRKVADNFAIPNGMVISPDGRTLTVAETLAQQLVAFDRAPDGSLSGRRVVATFAEGQPDGLALDAAGGIWAGFPRAGYFARIDPNGAITEEVRVPDWWTVACALGGPDRTTLYMAVCQTTLEDMRAGKARGQILATTVEVPGAGWP